MIGPISISNMEEPVIKQTMRYESMQRKQVHPDCLMFI